MAKPKPPAAPMPPHPPAADIESKVCDIVSTYADRSSTWLYNNQGARLGQGATPGVWLGLGADYLNDIRLDINSWVGGFGRNGIAVGDIKANTTVAGLIALTKKCF